jgi:hypothetical protein
VTIGTKSILYGAHCFFLHPFFVAAAWRRLYGFPLDLRLWVAFLVHDLGYVGRGDMNGSEGEDHVHLGASLMRRLFGRHWEEFTRCHSRYWAKRTQRQFSHLCVADKLAFVITPLWLYMPMTRWTGELPEYMEDVKSQIEDLRHLEPWEEQCLCSSDPRAFLEGLRSYTKRWVEKHKDLVKDEWTVPREWLKSHRGTNTALTKVEPIRRREHSYERNG